MNLLIKETLLLLIYKKTIENSENNPINVVLEIQFSIPSLENGKTTETKYTVSTNVFEFSLLLLMSSVSISKKRAHIIRIK